MSIFMLQGRFILDIQNINTGYFKDKDAMLSVR